MVKQKIYKINDFFPSCRAQDAIYWNKFGYTLLCSTKVQRKQVNPKYLQSRYNRVKPYIIIETYSFCLVSKLSNGLMDSSLCKFVHFGEFYAFQSNSDCLFFHCSVAYRWLLVRNKAVKKAPLAIVALYMKRKYYVNADWSGFTVTPSILSTSTNQKSWQTFAELLV